MTSNSRGSASVVALFGAVVLVLGSLWIAFGDRDPEVDARVRALQESRVPDPHGSAGLDALDEAVALSNRGSEWSDEVAVPEDLRFSRLPRPAGGTPPGVTGLEGRLDGTHIVLRWAAVGDPPAGFLLERIDEKGDVVARENLPGDARTFRDGPVDALAGTRIYRVTAVTADGAQADGIQKSVPYRVIFDVRFLGATPDGSARFEVRWERDGKLLAHEFAVSPGGEIGERVEGLDLRTGWRFVGLRAERKTAERELRVPVFGPDGRIAKDPDTGDVVFEQESVTLETAMVGAVVNPWGRDGDVWLPRAMK